jgi:hypothetical protein
MVVQELVATLGAKIEQGEFADAFALLDHLSGAFEKVFSAIADGVTEAFKTVHHVAEMGDEVSATAEKLGIAVDVLQELGYAALLSDTSAETLTSSLKFLSKAAAEAASGSKDAKEAFAGIKISDAKGMLSIQDILENTADKFASMPPGVEKTALALKLFGRAGIDLVPLLNKGAAGIGALREEAQRLGVVLDTSTIAAAEAYDDQLKRLESTVGGLQNQFAKNNISKVTELFGKLQKLMTGKGVQRAVDALARGFGRLVDTLGVLVDGLDLLLSNETIVETALFALTAITFGLAAAAATAGSTFVVAALEAAAAWIGAALPFIALGALIALIVDDIYTFIEGGDSMLGRIIGWFNSIDPEDNEFVKLLKSAGALLFDLTDPEKWKKLGQAIFDWVMSPVKALVSSLKWILEKLGVDTKGFNFEVNTNLGQVAPGLADPLSLGGKPIGDAIAEKFPGLADPFGLNGQSVSDMLVSKFPGIAPAVSAANKVSEWDQKGGDFISSMIAPGAVSPSASAAVSSSVDSSKRSTVVQSSISISVPPGTDAAGVAEAARLAVREELGGHLQDAHAANGGN